MTYSNGHAAKPLNATAAQTTTKRTRTKQIAEKERSAPAYVITLGRVVTQVWAESTCWGAVTWRVSQYRSSSYGEGNGHFRSYHTEDLQNAMRGLYRAQRWIKRTERKRRSWFGRW